MNIRKITAILGVTILSLASTVGPCTMVTFATMSEEMLEQYAQNNILFYDPYGSNICAEESTSGNYQIIDPSAVFYDASDNAGAIMGTLMANGYTRQSAAAIVGNMYAESRLNPRVLQGGSIVVENFRAWDGDGKTYQGGFGLVQWDYASRVQQLQAYADSHGYQVATLQAQVGFAIEELPQYGFGPSGLNAMDLHDAVYGIWRSYENPATSDFDTRYGFAEQFLGTEVADMPEIVPVDGSDGVDGVSGISSEVVNCLPEGYGGTGSPVTEDGVISFNQCDPEWGDMNYGREGVTGGDLNSICDSGCGPTALASILATLGENVTPVDTADYAGRQGMHVPGAGSSWDVTQVIAEHWGYSFAPLGNASIDTINEKLREGYLINAVGKGGLPFSTGGHYVAIMGITDSGEWIIADPYQVGRPGISRYDPAEVKSYMSSAWAVGK